jgi:predicted phosphodiesterase
MNLDARSDRRHAWWLAVALMMAGTWTFSACGDEPATSPEPPSPDGTRIPGEGDATDGTGASSSGSAGEPEDAAPAEVPGATPPNLKVAFIGDTAAGNNFKSVLQLIKREKADFVMIQGDMTYSTNVNAAATWFTAADSELDDGTTKIPYFVSRGNHDDDWDNLGAGFKDRLTKWGVAPEHNDPTVNNYSLVYKGLKMVFVHEVETANPTRAEYVNQRLENDPHIWKICSWHKNQRNSNVGPKSDAMGWQIYENCRMHGAIVAQGHSHTYSRSKTLTSDQDQTVDPACSDPFSLCVAKGKHFFFDSSLGGVGLRSLQNDTLAHWASAYSADYGALFIEFHVDGDPRKAKGYFKTVGDVIIDPPASSGQTFFTITSAP